MNGAFFLPLRYPEFTALTAISIRSACQCARIGLGFRGRILNKIFWLSGKLQSMISLAEPLRTRRLPLRSQRLCERRLNLFGTRKFRVAHHWSKNLPGTFFRARARNRIPNRILLSITITSTSTVPQAGPSTKKPNWSFPDNQIKFKKHMNV